MGRKVAGGGSAAVLSVSFRIRPWIGPMAAVGLAGLLLLIRLWEGYRVANPNILFALIIVVAAYLGGMASGLTSAAIALIFSAFDWAIPGHPWSYTAENFQRIIIAVPCLPGMALLVGMLKARTDLQYQTISKYAASLQESEEIFAKAFKHNPVISTIANLEDGTFLDVNEAFCRTLGWSWDEAVGHTGADLGLWTKAGQREGIVSDVKRYGRIQQFETDCLSKTGEIRTLLWNCDVIHTQNQPALLVSAEDITERKQAEEMLMETNAYLENLINYANAPIIVWDPEFKITRFNHAFESLTGRTESEVRGESLEILFPSALAEDSMDLIRKTLTGERWETVEIKILNLDGTVRTVLWNSATLFAPDNTTPVATIAQGQDITRRKHTEEALVLARDEIKAIYDNAPVMMCVIDANRQVLSVNPAFVAFTETPEHDLKGGKACGVFGCINALDDPAGCGFGANCRNCSLRLALEDTQKTGKVHDNLEYRTTLSQNGSMREVTLLASTAAFHSGEGTRVLLCLIDITALRLAEEEKAKLLTQLLQAQNLESLGTLVAGVAHNLNNVLAIAMGAVSMRQDLVTDPADREAYQTIGKVCGRGREVVKSLIRFAQPTIVTQSPIELNSLIQEVCALLESTTRKRIQILELLTEEPLWINGNSGDLNHILVNLGINSLDAMPDGGTLTFLTAILEGNWLEVTVEDSGSGMTPEVLAHALDPFFTTKDASTGAGLGLSMTYGVIKAHGGTIEIVSQPSQGTAVKLRFPSIPTPVQGGTAHEPAPSLKLRQVLLVDDEEDVRFLMTRMLKKAGVGEVETAASGEEALEKLLPGGLPDVLILDQNMPGMTGVQLMARVRDRYPDLPILLSSGQPDIESWEILKQPKVSVISKPFTLKEIQAKLVQFSDENISAFSSNRGGTN